MSLINNKIRKITNYKLFGDLKEGDPIYIYLKHDKILEFCFNVMTIENLKNLDQIGCLTSLRIEYFNDWGKLIVVPSDCHTKLICVHNSNYIFSTYLLDGKEVETLFKIV